MLVELLATARVTRLITEDSITEPLRDRAMEIHPKLGELVHCRMCTSIWAGAAVVAASRLLPGLNRMLALSEGTILLREKI